MTITVHVKLRQSASELIMLAGGHLIEARVKSEPIENKANLEVIALLAKHYKVPKSSIVLVRGGKSKIKVFEFK